jgi:hypothetical protein
MRITRLTSTLVQRPDLAQKVTGLVLGPQTESVPVDFVVLAASANARAQQAFGRYKTIMSELQVVGILLALLSNLRYLSPEVIVDGTRPMVDPSRYGNASGGFVFVNNMEGYTQELASNPGLAKLRSMYLHARNVSWEWIMLPSLRKLQLGRHCRLADYSNAVGTSTIEVLEIDCTTEVFIDPVWKYRHLGTLLERCPVLQTVILNVCDLYYFDAHTPWQTWQMRPFLASIGSKASFEALFRMLGSFSTTLEEVHIEDWDSEWAPECPDYLDRITPVTTLVHFAGLRYLTIPYKGLLYHSWAVTGTLQDILPPNLEELHITWPYITING